MGMWPCVGSNARGWEVSGSISQVDHWVHATGKQGTLGGACGDVRSLALAVWLMKEILGHTSSVVTTCSMCGVRGASTASSYSAHQVKHLCPTLNARPGTEGKQSRNEERMEGRKTSTRTPFQSQLAAALALRSLGRCFRSTDAAEGSSVAESGASSSAKASAEAHSTAEQGNTPEPTMDPPTPMSSLRIQPSRSSSFTSILETGIDVTTPSELRELCMGPTALVDTHDLLAYRAPLVGWMLEGIPGPLHALLMPHKHVLHACLIEHSSS